MKRTAFTSLLRGEHGLWLVGTHGWSDHWRPWRINSNTNTQSSGAPKHRCAGGWRCVSFCPSSCNEWNLHFRIHGIKSWTLLCKRGERILRSLLGRSKMPNQEEENRIKRGGHCRRDREMRKVRKAVASGKDFWLSVRYVAHPMSSEIRPQKSGNSSPVLLRE